MIINDKILRTFLFFFNQYTLKMIGEYKKIYRCIHLIGLRETIVKQNVNYYYSNTNKK